MSDEGTAGGQGLRFEHLGSRTRPVPDSDERAVQVGRVVPAPEQDVGLFVVADRQHPLSEGVAFDHHVRRDRKQVRTRQHLGTVRVGQSSRDPAAEDPDRPVVDAAIESWSTMTLTSHPAIARSKIRPPIDITASAMFAATT